MLGSNRPIPRAGKIAKILGEKGGGNEKKKEKRERREMVMRRTRTDLVLVLADVFSVIGDRKRPRDR